MVEKKSMIAAAQRAALCAAQAEFGKERVYVAGEHEKHQFGFNVPSLALRYLIGMTTWPLQRITQSQGPQYSCKSAFIFQLERWVLEAGGVVFHVDTENKVSSSLQAAMIPERFLIDPEYSLMYQQATLQSINEWQRFVTQQLVNMKDTAKQFSGKKDAKPDYMMFIAVDSMLGSGSEESSKYIQKQGEAQGRTFSDASLLIANYMRDMPTKLIGWPVNVHFSHHEKDDPSARFGGKRHGGGSAPDFMATLDLVFSLGRKKPSDSYADSGGPAFTTVYDGKTMRPGVQGRWVTIGIKKNSEGPAIKRQISVPFVWRYDKIEEEPTNPDAVVESEGAQYKQVAWWDWDTACVDMCLNHATQLKDVLKIERKTGSRETVYYCEAAGVSPEDAMLQHELGAVIESNEKLSRDIVAALHLNRTRVFYPDIWDEINPKTRRTKKS